MVANILVQGDCRGYSILILTSFSLSNFTFLSLKVWAICTPLPDIQFVTSEQAPLCPIIRAFNNGLQTEVCPLALRWNLLVLQDLVFSIHSHSSPPDVPWRPLPKECSTGAGKTCVAFQDHIETLWNPKLGQGSKMCLCTVICKCGCHGSFVITAIDDAGLGQAFLGINCCEGAFCRESVLRASEHIL